RFRTRPPAALPFSPFCCREGFPSPSFYAWRRRLTTPPTAVRPERPLFVPLQFDSAPRPEETAPDHGFEIELPHHVRLRCAAAPEPEWLGRLVAALSSLAPQAVSR